MNASSEYARDALMNWDDLSDMAGDLQDSGVLPLLMRLSCLDSAEAGHLLNRLTEELAENTGAMIANNHCNRYDPTWIDPTAYEDAAEVADKIKQHLGEIRDERLNSEGSVSSNEGARSFRRAS